MTSKQRAECRLAASMGDKVAEVRLADDNLERRIRREMGWGCLTCGVLVAVIWALFCLLIEVAK